jgi:hypothetical protein
MLFKRVRARPMLEILLHARKRRMIRIRRLRLTL